MEMMLLECSEIPGTWMRIVCQRVVSIEIILAVFKGHVFFSLSRTLYLQIILSAIFTGSFVDLLVCACGWRVRRDFWVWTQRL